jgi:hypothetical protein
MMDHAHLLDLALKIQGGLLRRVTLSDGRSVIVDADDPNSDAAIREAVEGD